MGERELGLAPTRPRARPAGAVAAPATPRPSGWMAEQTSWPKPGSVSSAVRVPPPWCPGPRAPAPSRPAPRGSRPPRARWARSPRRRRRTRRPLTGSGCRDPGGVRRGRVLGPLVTVFVDVVDGDLPGCASPDRARCPAAGPPNAPSRSRMLTKPWPVSAPPASNPGPSSATSKRELVVGLADGDRQVGVVAGVLARVLHGLEAAEVDGGLGLGGWRWTASSTTSSTGRRQRLAAALSAAASPRSRSSGG